MKTKLLTLTAVSVALFSTSALALPVIGFNSAGTGAGGYVNADTWNYATDRGVDVGNQNFVVGGNVGEAHTFHTQMAINSFQIAGQTFNPPGGLNGLPTGYELTKELIVSDKVTGVVANAAGDFTVSFSGVEDTNAKLSIYYDTYNAIDTSKANGGTGATNVSCYGGIDNCGVATDQTGASTQTGGAGEITAVSNGSLSGEILRAHQLSTTSSFTAPTLTAPGTGTGSFNVLWKIDFYDPRYIDLSNLGNNMIFADLMDGTLTVPSTQNPDHMWDGTTPGAPNSKLFDITGKQTFQAVPEPSSLALLGAGLLFFSGYSRRKKA